MSIDEKQSREAAKFLDNLTSFLTEDNRPTEEIAESLRTQGIDPEESLAQFQEILSQLAPTWKQQAMRERKVAQEAFQEIHDETQRTRKEVQNQIREIVEFMRGRGVRVQTGAFYRKFQEAKDEDLESLLEDLKIQQRELLKQQPNSDAKNDD